MFNPWDDFHRANSLITRSYRTHLRRLSQ